MKKTILAALFCSITTVAMAQVPPVVTSTGVHNPAGGYDINGEIWVGDSQNGILHLAPDDRTVADPLSNTTYSADLTAGWTIEGIPGNQFAQFNEMGQLTQVSDTLAYLAVRDNGKNAAGKQVGGIYAVPFSPQFTFPVSPIGTPVQLVPDKGLAGPKPTSVALGPVDGKVYFGNAGNPTLQRVNGANVEPVGTALSGQPIWSLGFLGSNLYLGTGDGFYVLPDPSTCFGNANNCGRPTLITSGTTVAVTGDGNGHVYFSQSTGLVRRLTVADGTIIQIASGLSFTNTTASLWFDRDGNLRIGDAGKMYRILAAALPM